MADAPLTPVARYRVLFGDCDPMRIVYYGNYLRLFEIGRAELFRRLGHPFKDYVDRGLYLAVIGAECRYRKPARYDDELDILAGIEEIGRVRVRIAYAVERDGERLVEGRTEHAILDDAGRPQRIPPEVRALADAGA